MAAIGVKSRLPGVWAQHQTLAGCQRDLREALSDWLALRLRLGLEIPELPQPSGSSNVGVLQQRSSRRQEARFGSEISDFKSRIASLEPPASSSRGDEAHC